MVAFKKQLVQTFGVLLALSACTSPGLCQDTLQARILSSVLPDGTMFRYSGGPAVLISPLTSNRYLHFNSSTTSLPTNYVRTEPFISHGYSDVIWFSRALFIDDNNVKRNADTTLTASQTDSMVLAWYNSRLSKQVAPGASYFDSTSQLNYILSLYDAVNDSVLKDIDTLQVYRNDDGNLRYINLFRSFNWRKFHLPSSTNGLPVYLNVRLESSLPTGVTLAYDYENLDAESDPDTTHGFSINYQEGYPGAPAPKRTNLLELEADAPQLDLVLSHAVSPEIQVAISRCSGDYSLSVANESGRMLWSTSGRGSGGTQRIPLPGSLPAGAYFITLQSGGREITKEFTNIR